MATGGKAQIPDFAPTWLKIQDNAAPPSTDELCREVNAKTKPHSYQQNSHSDDTVGTNSHGEPDVVHMQRHQFLDQFYAGRSYSQTTSRERPHAADSDYYYADPFYECYGYNGYESLDYGTERGNAEKGASHNKPVESKYVHPHARYDRQTSTGFSDAYPFDFYNVTDAFFPDYKKSEVTSSGARHTNFENRDEFPSLHGEGSDTFNQKVGETVWDKPNGRVYDVIQPKSTSAPSNTLQSCDVKENKSTSIYKMLVPNKPQSSQTARFNGNLTPPIANGMTKNSNPPPLKLKESVRSESSTRQSPTPSSPIEILSGRLVKQTRNNGDRKTDFLRTLKHERTSQEREDENSNPRPADRQNTNCCQPVKVVSRKMASLSVDLDKTTLSSSLEAEQRLLKEMGWKEEEDDYVITEDDMKEFQNLAKQKQGKSGQGVTRNKNWPAPKLTEFYKNNVQDWADSPASSDSEEEE